MGLGHHLPEGHTLRHPNLHEQRKPRKRDLEPSNWSTRHILKGVLIIVLGLALSFLLWVGSVNR